MLAVLTLAAIVSLAAHDELDTSPGALLDRLEASVRSDATEREGQLLADLREVGLGALRPLLCERAERVELDPAASRAILHVLRDMGTPGEFDLAVAAADGGSSVATEAVQRDLQETVESILSRHPDAHGSVVRPVLNSDPVLATSLLRALGRSGCQGRVELAELLGRAPALDLVVLGELLRSLREAGRTHEPEVADEVRSYLYVSDPQLLRESSQIIGLLVDGESTARLVDLLEHDSPAVRGGAERALGELTGFAWGSDLVRWKTWLHTEEVWYERVAPKLFNELECRQGPRILAALAELGGHHFRRDTVSTRVAVALADRSPDVRAAACGTLARLGWAGSVEPLLQHLATEADHQVLDALDRALVSLSGLPVPGSGAQAWRDALESAQSR